MEAACNVLSIAYGLQIANAAVLMTNMFGVWPQDELDWFHRIFIEDIFMTEMSGCLIVTVFLEVCGRFFDSGLACQVLFLAGERYAYIWHVMSTFQRSSPFDTEALDWCQVTGKPLAFLCLLPLSRIQCWDPFGKPICRGHSDQAYINHFFKDMLAPKTFHPDIRSSFVVVVLDVENDPFFRVALRWRQIGCFVILF